MPPRAAPRPCSSSSARSAGRAPPSARHGRAAQPAATCGRSRARSACPRRPAQPLARARRPPPCNRCVWSSAATAAQPPAADHRAQGRPVGAAQADRRRRAGSTTWPRRCTTWSARRTGSSTARPSPRADPTATRVPAERPERRAARDDDRLSQLTTPRSPRAPTPPRTSPTSTTPPTSAAGRRPRAADLAAQAAGERRHHGAGRQPERADPRRRGVDLERRGDAGAPEPPGQLQPDPVEINASTPPLPVAHSSGGFASARPPTTPGGC